MNAYNFYLQDSDIYITYVETYFPMRSSYHVLCSQFTLSKNLKNRLITKTKIKKYLGVKKNTCD